MSSDCTKHLCMMKEFKDIVYSCYTKKSSISFISEGFFVDNNGNGYFIQIINGFSVRSSEIIKIENNDIYVMSNSEINVPEEQIDMCNRVKSHILDCCRIYFDSRIIEYKFAFSYDNNLKSIVLLSNSYINVTKNDYLIYILRNYGPSEQIFLNCFGLVLSMHSSTTICFISNEGCQKPTLLVPKLDAISYLMHTAFPFASKTNLFGIIEKRTKLSNIQNEKVYCCTSCFTSIRSFAIQIHDSSIQNTIYPEEKEPKISCFADTLQFSPYKSVLKNPKRPPPGKKTHFDKTISVKGQWVQRLLFNDYTRPVALIGGSQREIRRIETQKIPNITPKSSNPYAAEQYSKIPFVIKKKSPS